MRPLPFALSVSKAWSPAILWPRTPARDWLFIGPSSFALARAGEPDTSSANAAAGGTTVRCAHVRVRAPVRVPRGQIIRFLREGPSLPAYSVECRDRFADERGPFRALPSPPSHHCVRVVTKKSRARGAGPRLGTCTATGPPAPAAATGLSGFARCRAPLRRPGAAGYALPRCRNARRDHGARRSADAGALARAGCRGLCRRGAVLIARKESGKVAGQDLSACRERLLLKEFLMLSGDIKARSHPRGVQRRSAVDAWSGRPPRRLVPNSPPNEFGLPSRVGSGAP